jgi:hypothetical protein
MGRLVAAKSGLLFTLGAAVLVVRDVGSGPIKSELANEGNSPRLDCETSARAFSDGFIGVGVTVAATRTGLSSGRFDTAGGAAAVGPEAKVMAGAALGEDGFKITGDFGAALGLGGVKWKVLSKRKSVGAFQTSFEEVLATVLR